MEDIQQGMTTKLDQLAKSIAVLQVQLSNNSPNKEIGDEKSILGAPHNIMSERDLSLEPNIPIEVGLWQNIMQIRCSHRIHCMIMSEEEEIAYIQPLISMEEEHAPEIPVEETQMSLHTLKDEDTIAALKFTGVYNGQSLQILVDTGSTLSFIKESTTHILGFKVEAVTPLLIKVHKGCDVILGDDWLKACSSIELDYELMTITVKWMGKKLKLYANKSQSECQFISHHSPFKLMYTSSKKEVEEFYKEAGTEQAFLLLKQTMTQKCQAMRTITSFQALYGYAPSYFATGPYLNASNEEVNEVIQERKLMLQQLKENLRRAQGRMRTYANRSREEKQFESSTEGGVTVEQISVK
ncbi:hypothetical protein C2S51_016050 [Perilla frutescens var. frutescens]|nr:hypothetical protein C2S51_016050 [Perilla frutescens var. frutescens]